MSLNKDDVFNFEKHAPTLEKVSVGLGWDAQAGKGPAYDLDASAVLLSEDGKLVSAKHACYFSNKLTADGAVQSMGDNLTGAGSGDDETINVTLSKIDSRVKKIVFWVTIYGATERKQSFEQVKNAFIRIYDTGTKVELAKFDLNENYILETAVEFAELNRVGNGWEFKAVGKGHTKSIAEVFNLYR